MSQTLVFVSHADSGDVHVLAMAGDGALTPVHQVQLGGTLMPMALSPCKRWLHVARRSEPMAVITLAIDRDAGTLTPIGESPLPGSMASITTDRTGRYLLAASYPDNLVSVSPIAADGTVAAVQQVVPTPPHAHAVLPSRSNRHMLVTSLGGDQLMVFRFDATIGLLGPEVRTAWTARPGAGPRHIRLDAAGHRLYLLNELDASLDVLAFDDASGRLDLLQSLSTLPPGFSGTPSAADLHLSPDGRWLYTSDRGSDTLAAFAIESDGRVRLIGHTPTESQPRGFAIDPSGQQLLVVGQRSHHLTRCAIDAATGRLDVRQRLPMGLNPNWIEILA